MEGLRFGGVICAGKFALQNQLGQFIVGRQIEKKLCITVSFLLCFILYLIANSKYEPPGANIQRGDLTEGFCVTSLGAYIWRGFFLEFYGS